jgi:NAD(P)-dependent dehydrogenase (short-subunit alcohol dehydrogenase family)
MRLENKVALITGGSGGIGRETAILFANEGAKIVVTDVNDAAGQETVDEIVKNGREALLSCVRMCQKRLIARLLWLLRRRSSGS